MFVFVCLCMLYVEGVLCGLFGLCVKLYELFVACCVSCLCVSVWVFKCVGALFTNYCVVMYDVLCCGVCVCFVCALLCDAVWLAFCFFLLAVWCVCLCACV